MIVNAATLPADAVIFDLEDAVPLDDKETARLLTKDYVCMMNERGILTIARVNALTTGLTAEDLETVVVKGLNGIMLAKTETASDITKLSNVRSLREKFRT